MDFQRRPLWYKDAVIYEVHLKSYLDSDGSGMGDFRGLISKLDYIRDLGVTAIWLLPFYPSPLRDDGYDIADYREVHPAYGTLEIFKEFLREAHAREIYVITEVVLNHTSDQHPWFLRARRAPAGSRERDFYVWSESPDKYRQARIIFKDYETSNWTWDPVAKAYFWHRFYGHQPDLNFDNPEVHQAVLDVLDYWLEMGVDGLRLDAIPYLYEREGSPCENLPETHDFIRKLAGHVHARYDHRMLLAEANQWPEDAAAYFGDGEGCDMAFHFPLMTRLYMAVEMEDRFPMVDILDQTPRIPENCQWAIFLRNHDELTLEMVTDEERDYMYRVFAKDRRARINLGIRRRLAPLLENNRRKIELLNALLLSLPGTPVIYYGDEIGMGDNLLLGDRDGVRTPMQWNAGPNAGFSPAPAEKLYLPVIADSENHYAAVNVALQEENPSSLLWWMRRRLRLRKSHPVFGRGTLRFLEPKNSRVLAFVRESEAEAVLVLANLSKYPQTAQLDLEDFRGAEPIELTGRTSFPLVEEGAYPVMLGAYDTLWILLRKKTEDDLTRKVQALADAGEWASLPDAVSGLTDSLLKSHAERSSGLEGKNRAIHLVRLRDFTVLENETSVAVLAVLRVEYLDGEVESRGQWIGFVPATEAEGLPAHALMARIQLQGRPGYLCEAPYLEEFRSFLTARLLQPGTPREMTGHLSVERLAGAEAPPASEHPTTRLRTRPGEFSILFDARWMLRGLDSLRTEPPPDLEILLELKTRFPEAKVPLCVARMEYLPQPDEPRMAGYVLQFSPAERQTRDLALENLRHFLSAVALAADARPFPVPDRKIPLPLGFHSLPPFLQEALGGSWSEFICLLGTRLAGLHGLLAERGPNPDFAAEPFTWMYRNSLYHSARSRVRRALLQLERNAFLLSENLRPLAAEAVGMQTEILSGFHRLTAPSMDGLRTRIHGNLKLDRILFTGKDFIFTCFDGLPWASSSERRALFSPLQDVAAVVRDLAGCLDEEAALQGEAQAVAKNAPAWAQTWFELSAGLFLDGYLAAAGGKAILPSREEDIRALLESFVLERAAFDLQDLAAPCNEIPSALRLLLRAASVVNPQSEKL